MQKTKSCLIVYSLTIFLSAFLLFSIQPMFTKMVLPILGGTPMVWNTAMMFFQGILLLGYLYAHFISQIKNVRTQAIIHCALLIVASIFVPIAKAKGWEPPTTTMPVFWLLQFFTVSIGLPFFAISATAPLLQRWFSLTDHKDAQNPYFLYGASNIGSILALLAYPFVIEMNLRLQTQGEGWGILYATLVLLITFCAIFVKSKQIIKAATKEYSEKISWKTRSLWVLYAFIPSALLLAVTSHISVDIAAIPLLWVMPLVIYLLSFVIVFARNPHISHNFITSIAPTAIIVAIIFYSLSVALSADIAIVITFLFIISMVFHGELAKNKPSATKLTEFYLLMSLGGVLGGIFNSIIAPAVFNDVYEYLLIVILSALALPKTKETIKSYDNVFVFPFVTVFMFSILIIAFKAREIIINDANIEIMDIATILALIIANYFLFSLFYYKKPTKSLRFMLVAALLCSVGYVMRPSQMFTSFKARSFFSTYKVQEDLKYAHLVSGKTIHGIQIKAPLDLQTMPTSYYSKKGPVGDIFNILDPIPNYKEKMGVVGLGTGTMSCYAKPGRTWTFFEIDPLTVQIAKDSGIFKFLPTCAPNADIILGDARVSLQKSPDNKFDVLFVDAFSSDAIPMHLITKEALYMYMSKIKKDGIVAIHISNKYINLIPVLAGYSETANIKGYFKHHISSEQDRVNLAITSSLWVIFSTNKALLQTISETKGWQDLALYNQKAFWSDDFSNIIPLIQTEPHKKAGI